MANYSMGFGYKFYIVPVLQNYVDFTQLNRTALGAGGFIDTTTLLNSGALVTTSGDASTFDYAIKLATPIKATISSVAIATNVATATTTSAHGIASGKSVTIAGCPVTVFNGTWTLTSVTSTTLVFALTTSNVATTTTTGSVTAYSTPTALDLTGSGTPLRLLGLTNLEPNESEKSESVMTYDNESAGFELPITTSKALSFKIEGYTDYYDAGYKVLRIACKDVVSQGLMVKWARIGPVGSTETTFGYGRLGGFNEKPPAGGIVKWDASLKSYGPYGLTFSGQ